MGESVDFGARLRRLRIEQGKSIAELARDAELTESAVYKIEAKRGAQPQAGTIVALARALDMSADELLGMNASQVAGAVMSTRTDAECAGEPDEPEPDPDLPPGAEPVGEMVLIPLYARVTAGEGGVIDTEIVEYHHLPRRFLPESELESCGLIEARGDSMTGAAGIEDGDWVLLCHNVEPQDGQIAVVDIDGEATVKRIYRTPDGIILQADNPAVPPRVISGPALEHTRVLGRVMRVIRQM
jgi:SOS-response transcriptional repressor LexA